MPWKERITTASKNLNKQACTVLPVQYLSSRNNFCAAVSYNTILFVRVLVDDSFISRVQYSNTTHTWFRSRL